MKQFSVSSSKTSSIPLKNSKRVREEEAGGVEEQPETQGRGKDAERGVTKWEEGG